MIDSPALVPELDVADLAVSLRVYREIFRFQVLAERPEEAFAYIANGRAHLMLQQADGPGRRFRTGPLERPYGRGLNLQILVTRLEHIYRRVRESRLNIEMELEHRW